MRKWLSLAALVVSLPVIHTTHAQQPARDATGGKAASTMGRLSGRVTALATGKPINRAVVMVASPALPGGRGVTTDADGQWTLADLPAGTYSVSVTKNGFLTLAYGQRRAFSQGTAVKLAAGQSLTKIDVAMPRAAAIVGRVVDEVGEPVENARVFVERQGFYSGQPRLTVIGPTVVTDDLGAFRVHSLPAGEYYLAITPPRRALAVPFDERTGYTRTYYPDAHSVANATRLPLQLGDELREIIVTMMPTRMVTVSGTAVDSTGRALERGFGTLRERTNRAASPVSEFSVNGGAWRITGVVPGDYLLSLPWGVAGSAAGVTREYAELPIAVGTEDIGGLALVTAAAGTASGRVRYDGPAPAGAFSDGHVHGVDPTGHSPAGSGAVMPDGTFRVDGLSGERLFRLDQSLERQDWLLKSVTLKGQDITDTPIAIPFGSNLTGLEVTLAKSGAELSGSVAASNGEPAAEFVVVVFPPEPERWGAHGRQIKVGRPDHTGAYTISRLPPATYLVAAVEYVEPGQEMHPEFLQRLSAHAVRITLGDNEKKTLSLKLAPQ